MFKLVLSEDNITSRKEYLQERKLLIIQIEEPELIMPQARKFFVKRKIDLEDFGKLKREYSATSRKLNTELFKINSLLKQPGDIEESELNFSSIIFQSYNKNEIADKRKMINLIAPVNIDQENLMIQPLKLNNALSKIIFKCA